MTPLSEGGRYDAAAVGGHREASAMRKELVVGRCGSKTKIGRGVIATAVSADSRRRLRDAAFICQASISLSGN